MSKKVKIVSWVLGVLVGLPLVAFLLSPLWLGQTAGIVANAVVPKFTGTDFNVDKIRVNPYTGTLRVEQLRLANPEGYDATNAVEVGLLYVKVEPFSVLKEVIKVNEITIENPFVSYLDHNGTNNISQILANVNSGKKEEPKKEDAADEGGGKKVIIEKISVSGIRVRYGMLTLPVPPVVLSNIGASKGGVSLENAGLEVWESIKSSFTKTGGAIGGAAKSLGSGAMDFLKNAADSDSAKSVGEGAKKATQALGNLFK